MRHPLYDQALADLSPYEQSVARALETYRPSWWQTRVHPQTMLDYLDARDDAHRVSAMVTMMRDAVNWAHTARQALHAHPGA